MLPFLLHVGLAFAALMLASTAASTGHGAANLTIDVVVLPHSHDDAGWQRTFEGYYRVETKNILDNVVAWLSANPAAKFIWVETSFLQRWWLDANVSSQQSFKDHLASGRLELVGGGWTMHDEESTNPYSAMSNMEYGLTWLSDTFGPQYRPRILWQIDPSGHSVFTPTLSAALGYDLLVLDRVPDPVRQAMRQQQGLQFVWTAVNSSLYHAGTSILSFVLEEFYCSPSLGSGDVASQAALFYTDVLRRSALLRANETGHITILWPWGCDFAFQQYSDFTLMEDILSYMASNASAFPGVSARLGTLSDYLTALHAQDIAFPTMGTRDFHPYIWCYEPSNWDLCYNLPTTPDGAYWRTGMYTSKVGLKGLSRVLDAAQHAAETLLVQARVEQSAVAARMKRKAAQASLRGSSYAFPDGHAPSLLDNSTWLPAVGSARATGALMTHHDAITGTAYVSCSLGPPYDDCNCFQDYMDRMADAVGGAAAAAGDIAGFLLAKAGVPAEQRPSFGNASTAAAHLTPSNILMLSVSNPLGWARREIVRLSFPPAYTLALHVVDMRTQETEQSQVVVDTLRNSSTLYFMADVPALSTVVYSITASAGASTPPVPAPTTFGQGLTLDNGVMAITYDSSGRIVSWSNHSSGLVLPLQHSFWLYPEKLAGGDLIGGTVYGFEPLADKEPQLVGPGINGTGDVPLTVLANGPLVWEVVQSVSPFLLHSVRMFAPAAAPTRASAGYAAAPPLAYTLEWQTQVLPLPYTNGTGGSLVSAFAPGAGCTFLPSGTAPVSPYSALTSDASGFQVLPRPPYNLSQYAQGQVYPSWPGWDWAHGPCDGSAPPGGSPSLLSLSMQRPTGTAVMSNTSLWTMLHRRLVNPSDDRGNDVTVVDDVIAVGLADPTSRWQEEADGVRLGRQVQGRLLAHPLQLSGALYASPAAYTAVGNAAYSPPWLAGSLPPGVHLHSTVSRERWYPPAPNSSTSLPPVPYSTHSGAGVQLGMRLQQLPHAPAATFDAAALLSGGGYTLASWQETTPDFGVDKGLSDARRMKWRTEQGEGEGGQGVPTTGTPTAVSFDAEYVRSYLLELQAPA